MPGKGVCYDMFYIEAVDMEGVNDVLHCLEELLLVPMGDHSVVHIPRPLEDGLPQPGPTSRGDDGPEGQFEGQADRRR